MSKSAPSIKILQLIDYWIVFIDNELNKKNTWFIPALAKSSVGSSWGMVDEECTSTCSYFLTKKSINICRICCEVNELSILLVLHIQRLENLKLEYLELRICRVNRRTNIYTQQKKILMKSGCLGSPLVRRFPRNYRSTSVFN